MNAAQFDIGQQVSFQHRGDPVLGRVVGVEHISDPRRGDGWTYTIATAAGAITVPQANVAFVTSER